MCGPNYRVIAYVALWQKSLEILVSNVEHDTLVLDHASELFDPYSQSGARDQFETMREKPYC